MVMFNARHDKMATPANYKKLREIIKPSLIYE